FVADAPKIDQFLSDEALAFFESVTSGLDAAGVKWKRAESLVRGLDYYRHTAFEFIPDEGSAAADALGAQSTVLGGGRYDGLMESLGGPATPAVGWAAGIERLAMLVGELDADKPDIVVVVEDDEMTGAGQAAVSAIRKAGLSADFIASGGKKKRFDKAVKVGSHVILAMSDGERRLRYQTEGASRDRLVAALKELGLD
ncbi:MAG: ATP phosphoribosyltransferase regulatory subunit, partial [Erythrobacter sp.]